MGPCTRTAKSHADVRWPDDPPVALVSKRLGVTVTSPEAEMQEGAVDPDDGDGVVTFSVDGVKTGFVEGLPVALGVAGYGLVFGVFARRAGLTVAEAALMSATVVAGAAQLLAVELWADPIPVVALVIAVTVVNLRYLLLGAALRPWIGHLPSHVTYGSAFVMADENWALTMDHFASGGRKGAYLLGSGIALWSLWVAATVVGAAAGTLVGAPETYGLDFVVVAVFLTLAVGLWEGRESLLPWAVAAAVGIGASWLVPGQWYVVLGGLAGALIAVVNEDA